MSEGYHPEKSRVNADTLADFIRQPITGDLKEVPGVGPATIALLKEHEISTTFGLIGKFLSFKEEGVGCVEHVDRFYYWLISINTPAGFRAGIVHAIAEKVNSVFVGIYDADSYGQP